MPPKKGDTDTERGKRTKQSTLAKRNAAICGITSPGPRYKLRTLVGYKDHCVSKYRNPAYTFGNRQTTSEIREGPGPKYMVMDGKGPAFTFGYAARNLYTSLGPGPKYKLPDKLKGPAFSIKFRTNYRASEITPAPYNLKSIIPGPAYSIGLRAIGAKCDITPAPYGSINMNAIKPKAPMYSLAYRQPNQFACYKPGPKYSPKIMDCSPKYSFGVKHSVCAPPYIVECDDKC